MFLRRVGPILQGVVLERFTDQRAYQPATFVHFLGRRWPTISLSLMRELRARNGASKRLRSPWRENEHQEAALKLAEQSALPLVALPTIEEIVDAYREWVERNVKPDWPFGRPALEDLVLVPATVGRDDLAKSGLELAANLAEAWPAEQLPHGDRWLEQLEAAAADQLALQRTVLDEIERHGLGSIPTHELRPS
jgi:hypothetical protein